MKKTLVAVMFVLILGVVAFTQVDPFSELHGSVAKVETWHYKTEEKFGNTVEVWDAHSADLYDADQNKIESIEYTKTGDIDKRTVWNFDSNGRLIQIEEYNWLGNLESKTVVTYEGNVKMYREYDETGNLKSASNTELDANGKELRTTIYDVDSGHVSTILEHGANGKDIRGTMYDVNSGKVTSVLKSTYTSDGKPLSIQLYDDKGNVISSDYQYGVEGMDAVEVTVIYLAGTEFKRSESGVTIQTDEYGNWTEERFYDHKERFGKMEWVLTDVHRREITYR